MMLALVTVLYTAFTVAVAQGANEPLWSAKPLTTLQGRASHGEKIVRDRQKGNCLLCHRVQQIDEPFQGSIGPDLSNVNQRLNPAQLRYRLIDNSRINPQTIMPAYYRTSGFQQVDPQYQAQSILSAQEIEDVVAYLTQLQPR